MTKIDKSGLFKGEKGTYLRVVLWENKGGTDEFGNDGTIVQDLGKERREKGDRGAILGNWRRVVKRGADAETAKPVAEDDDLDDIPF